MSISYQAAKDPGRSAGTDAGVKLRLWGAILLGCGLVIVAISIAVSVNRVTRTVTQTLHTIVYRPPLSTTVTLKPQTYGVYIPVTADAFAVNESTFSVAAPDGSELELTTPDMTNTMSIDGQQYEAAREFTVKTAGSYAISATGEFTSPFVLAPTLDSVIRSLIGWILFGVVGGLCLLLGAILLIIGFTRKRRVIATGVPGSWPAGYGSPGYGTPGYGTAAQQPPSYAGGPPPGWQPLAPQAAPPGWYQDPETPGRYRWWNGSTWQ